MGQLVNSVLYLVECMMSRHIPMTIYAIYLLDLQIEIKMRKRP